MDWMLKHSSQKSTISVTYDFVSLHGLLLGIVKEKKFSVLLRVGSNAYGPRVQMKGEVFVHFSSEGLGKRLWVNTGKTKGKNALKCPRAII